ncbi:unnamed protein product [Ectocarpus sp. CCAP 1310/34]|nr:unnamed protein product [Ectocarpus sp. CCAP 1310/34]
MRCWHRRNAPSLSSLDDYCWSRCADGATSQLQALINDRSVAREDRKRHSTGDAWQWQRLDWEGEQGYEVTWVPQQQEFPSAYDHCRVLWKHVTSMPSVHGSRSTA